MIRDLTSPIRLILMMLAVALAPLASIATVRACTTAVISGKVTADGRPILWKNRDFSSAPHNEVAEITGGRYKGVAVVNAGQRGSIWMGVNEAGFCIENSLSLDLKTEEKSKGPGNGGFMKKALQACATVEDFIKLLEETNESGRTTVANFGVIDAEGGAAIFETGPKTFVMFDANDPKVAPNGYVVRSNFATTARQMSANPTPEELKAVSSAGRYLRSCSIIETRDRKEITVDLLLRKCSRDMCDESGTPFPGTVNAPGGDLPEVINTKNTISRTSTVSAAVFHGVRPNENPALTTMWAILGDPKFSIAVPCFVEAGVADELAGEKGGKIGEVALALRDWHLTDDKEGVRTECLPQIWTGLWPLEDRILAKTLETKDRWSAEGVSPGAIETFHQQAATAAMQAMTTQLLETKKAALALDAPAPPKFEETPLVAAP